MGHKECGAIKAFVQGGEAQGHIRDIVDSIRAEAEIKGMDPVSQQTLDRCIRANIMHGIHQLGRQSALITEKMEKGELEVVGALYDLKQGLVSWIKE
jgi:carbonic anhydrase